MTQKEKDALRMREYRKRSASDPEYKARKAASDKAYRERNKEALSLKNKVKYAENSEVVKSKVKAYAASNQDKIKEYRVLNKDKRNAQTKDWHDRHKEHDSQYRAMY